MVSLSVLDLAPIVQGSNASQALANARELARHAEQLDYRRFWLAEHHNMVGIASAATAVVMGYVAAATRTIRVGAGGIMLPNHSPLVIAEQFGTLEALYPGRIDLGVGRAPGSDMVTQRALRRSPNSAQYFPDDVRELIELLRPQPAQRAVRAVPGSGSEVPVWMLGSSLFGAELAAELGLPYAFASHFAPAQMHEAIALYRARFQPSEKLEQPHVMLGLNVIAADSDAEARLLFTSLQQAFVNLRRGTPGMLPPPRRTLEGELDASDHALLRHALSCSVIGSPKTVREGIAAFVAETRADELMITAQIYDHEARLRSLTLTREASA
jgi:luciferase family oxidoreductase group 1